MSGIKRFIIKFIILAAMLLGMPLLGVTLAGMPILRYLEFPPKTHYVRHAPFSWIAFAIYTACIMVAVTPLILRGVRSVNGTKSHVKTAQTFPWWGWVGLTAGLISWIVAWSRFPWFAGLQPHTFSPLWWFAGLQPHTFSPLWFSFIVVINALVYRRTRHCLMMDRPGFFLLLFPTSAAFWWFFEYLNRFVQNWYYIGPDFSPQEYFWYATLPFSTVLPAVLSTRQWLLSGRFIRQRYTIFKPFNIAHYRIAAAVTLCLAAAGLTGIGVWPNYLFPVLWVSPLLIIVSLQILMKEQSLIDQMGTGDWSVAVASVSAALFCGFFWEMWNYFSLAKWEYSIPFVNRYQIFEMPILGYAGYLPFGLECTVVGALVDQVWRPAKDG
jgi:hypothetical protein